MYERKRYTDTISHMHTLESDNLALTLLQKTKVAWVLSKETFTVYKHAYFTSRLYGKSNTSYNQGVYSELTIQ